MTKAKSSTQSISERKKIMCYECLPAQPMDKHLSLKGIMVHSRTDCPPDQLYMMKEENFKTKFSTQKEWETKLENDLISLMENKVESVIGEDGLTVWDFAELRDSILAFISNLLADQRKEILEESEEFKKILNQFDISSDGIDDDNEMLKQLIVECRTFLALIERRDNYEF